MKLLNLYDAVVKNSYLPSYKKHNDVKDLIDIRSSTELFLECSGTA